MGSLHSDRTSPFGQLLRSWRARRGLSQLDLALSGGVSQRHVSFLESGRARPSREMVLQLAATLAVPLRHQNDLLLAAGFAPAFNERELSDPELGDISRAISHVLAQQEPFPAIVVDRYWTLMQANQAAGRMLSFLLGAPPPGGEPVNLLRLLFSPQGLRPVVANWSEVARALWRRLQVEVLAEGPDERGAALLEELAGTAALPPDWRMVQPDDWTSPLLTVRFARNGVRIELFSTVTTLGTPRDVTLQDVRIESFFPADEATERLFRRWRHDA